jgi:hypothetical protein
MKIITFLVFLMSLMAATEVRIDTILAVVR